MASIEALVEQGVPASVTHACVQYADPIKFETGNCIAASDTRIEGSGNKFGKSSFCSRLMPCRSFVRCASFQWKTICIDIWSTTIIPR